ncbi:MAG: hypothetical protein QXH97_05085 [Candidatus Bathyarchaeia archaeon]
MPHIYEYLFAAVITVSVLLASSLMLNIISEPLRIASEKENLKAAAQTILTQILLNPGSPEDWGSNITIKGLDLTSFGLAPKKRITKEVYTLDADKISRLNKMNPFYIPPYYAGKALGLSPEYGFTIEIFPALDVNVSETQPGLYNVEVRTIYGGNPVLGANVTARIYYLNSGSIMAIPNNCSLHGVTGYDGRCAINFGFLSSARYVAIFLVDYSGMRVMEVISSDGIKQNVLAGKYFLLAEKHDFSEDSVFEVIACQKNGVYEIEHIKSKIRSVARSDDGFIYEIEYVEPQLISVLASSGNDYLMLASRKINLVYGTIVPSALAPPLGFVIEKIVLVDGFSYAVRLYLWRLVW